MTKEPLICSLLCLLISTNLTGWSAAAWLVVGAFWLVRAYVDSKKKKEEDHG